MGINEKKFVFEGVVFGRAHGYRQDMHIVDGFVFVKSVFETENVVIVKGTVIDRVIIIVNFLILTLF